MCNIFFTLEAPKIRQFRGFTTIVNAYESPRDYWLQNGGSLFSNVLGAISALRLCFCKNGKALRAQSPNDGAKNVLQSISNSSKNSFQCFQFWVFFVKYQVFFLSRPKTSTYLTFEWMYDY